jgi:aspartate/tyrosine/aromatic aminotransferase
VADFKSTYVYFLLFLFPVADRTGCLTILLKEGRQEEVGSIKMMLTIIARALYLCPTKHGAEIVIQTLKDPTLREQW